MSQKPFAKLFEDQEYGQILMACIDDEDGNPAIRVSVKPHWSSTCEATLSYDEPWQREHNFAKADLEWATQIAEQIFALSAKACGVKED